MSKLTSTCFILFFGLMIVFNVSSQVYQDPNPTVLRPFADKSGLLFMPDGIMATADPSTDGEYKKTEILYTVPYTCKIDQIRVLLKGHIWGDYAYMEVLNSAGDTVLAQFGQKLYFDDSIQDQGWIGPEYNADLVSGLKIRFNYFTKKPTTGVSVIFNLKLHKVVP